MGQTLGSAPVNPGCRRFINRESAIIAFTISFSPFRFVHFYPLQHHPNTNTYTHTPPTVPRSCIYGLWEAFNDIAEGFGLTIEEYQEIIKSALLIYLNVTEKVLNVDTDNVFKLFDDDEVS